jgi:hypothetical protein
MRFLIERTLRAMPCSSTATPATGLPLGSTVTSLTCALPCTETQSSARTPTATAAGHSDTVRDKVWISPFGSG